MARKTEPKKTTQEKEPKVKIPKSTKNVVVERYSSKDGPSKEAYISEMNMLTHLKDAFSKIIEHEMDTKKDEFDLHKFIFEFGRSIQGLVNVKFPELDSTFLKAVRLTQDQEQLLFSYMVTVFGVPFTMLLAEWYNAEKNGILMEGSAETEAEAPEEEEPHYRKNIIRLRKGEVVN